MEPLDLVEFKVEDTPGADVYYVPNFINAGLADAWYEQLEELQFYHPTLKVYGKSVRQNRSIAAYSSSDSLEFKYSGHQVDMKRATDIPPILSTIWQHVSARLGLQFNCILINRYANGDENIGKHRDGKENGVIASLSLGAVRKFHLIPNRTDTGATTKKWPLANGSLLVMRGATQDNWKHEIPKEPEVKHGRISLTFRQLPEAVAKGQRPTCLSPFRSYLYLLH
ncbi:Fe2OG dioxygenase domain-containing protein [Mycena indigotica]|uniref:Fe2OG dioxygenase domain-containing protein n=1 Tax=Mycena indigotica TaxID=2126181 RepID=A0A8H6WKQ6_9AGAR|nr:Fe2OG dioxygenase domain-containing protein [Mycena indigotica]KAF7315984.1 Fe2OG dioxygenase domain-containing protein [Mycena indigotica]